MTTFRTRVDCHGDELEQGECYVTRFDFEADDVHHGPACHLHRDQENDR